MFILHVVCVTLVGRPGLPTRVEHLHINCMASRLRLGLPPSDVLAYRCTCSVAHRHSDRMQVDPWHYLSCNFALSHSMTKRHNAVRDAIVRVCNKAGITTIREPAHLFTDGNKRPDAQIIYHNTNTLIDIAVSNPIAPTHATHAAQHILGTATNAEKRKNDKYNEDCRAFGADFIPFSVEVFGGLGEQARQLIKFIHNIALANPSPIYSARELVNELVSSVAVAVQVGNAMCIQEGIRLQQHRHS